MTQNQRILDYVSAHGSITQLIAAHMEPAILRLSERIRELENDGYCFGHIHEKHNTGTHTRYVYNGRADVIPTVTRMIQADTQCPKCGSWYAEIKNGIRTCNKCKVRL